jgi:ATP-binding cassette subfamily G (WHITE) protein 2
LRCHVIITITIGGYFISPKALPTYFSWLDALSYVKYAYIGVSLNELHGLNLQPNSTCTAAQLAAQSTGCVTSGQYTIDSLGLSIFTIPDLIGILISYIILARIAAYLAIRFIKW